MTGTLPDRRSAASCAVVSPAPRAAWELALDADPAALPSQTPQWTDWLCRTRGYTDASRLYEFPDGRRLLLPLVARTVAGVRVSEESMPYGFGYGGPLALDGGQPTPEQARAVLADLATRPVLRTSLSPAPQACALWTAAAPAGTVTRPYLAHVLDLEGGWERVQQGFRKAARRNLRRAQDQPFDVRTGPGSGVVEVFDELNRRAVDRWARERGQPRWLARQVERRRDRTGQLASALTELGPMVRAWTVHLHGRPIAANVDMHVGDQAYGWLLAVDRDLAQQTQVGTLVMALGIEAACASGLRRFQLGESEPGSGVALFKERFGATPVPWSALSFERLPLTPAEQRIRSSIGRLAALRQGAATQRPPAPGTPPGPSLEARP